MFLVPLLVFSNSIRVSSFAASFLYSYINLLSHTLILYSQKDRGGGGDGDACAIGCAPSAVNTFIPPTVSFTPTSCAFPPQGGVRLRARFTVERSFSSSKRKKKRDETRETKYKDVRYATGKGNTNASCHKTFKEGFFSMVSCSFLFFFLVGKGKVFVRLTMKERKK